MADETNLEHYSFNLGLNEKVLIDHITYNFKAYPNDATVAGNHYFPATLTQDTAYNYTTKDCFEATSPNGKFANGYSIIDYPNKFSWGSDCGLPLHESSLTNTGDAPCPFIYTFISTGSETSIKLDGMATELKFTADAGTTTWDSKTGLVKNSEGKIVPTIGQSCYAMPVGGTFPNSNYTYDLLFY